MNSYLKSNSDESLQKARESLVRWIEAAESEDAGCGMLKHSLEDIEEEQARRKAERGGIDEGI